MGDIDNVFRILKKEVPKYDVPVVDLIEIQTHDPHKVLIATILSARTKDETTAAVCEKLFKKVKTVSDLTKHSEKQLADMIYPVGFYKQKAKSLKKLPQVLEEEFDGSIPEEIDDLVKLPGVGRKTANLVRSVAFKKDAICVDTHVHRIMNRLGYVETKTPEETEMVLREKLPKKYWQDTNRLFVAFGQNVCAPQSPWCSQCPVHDYCKRVGVERSR